MYETITKQSSKITEMLSRIHSYDFSEKDMPGFEKHVADLRERSKAYLTSVPETADKVPDFFAEVFAVIKETFKRTLGIEIYDEQLWAGIVLFEGAIAEMATGEGKTFAASFPAVLNSFLGAHTDIYTFNDYLAKRDAIWLKPVYDIMGVSVSYLQEGQDIIERKAAYAADITYMTARESGFDYLREFIAESPDELTNHSFRYAIIDEADSILIDEARIPLVLAASTGNAQTDFLKKVNAIALGMTKDIDYSVDDYDSNVFLTEDGIIFAERYLGIDNLYDEENIETVVALNNALYAHEIVRRDIDYIVKDDKISLVDEFTGRVAHKRHWPHGVHEAIEIKEGLDPSKRGKILAQITLQNFMRLYERLSGMTGTASLAAEEFDNTYDLKVHVIPTHKQMIREDAQDIVFYRKDDKYRSIIKTVLIEHSRGRPILIGTGSVEESETLSSLLSEHRIACNVLNAKNDELEASLIAHAGEMYAVTVSTNMAGRGIDIKLGGPQGTGYSDVVNAGGLLVIGTNRHESIRVDNQLRGRAGRQGDPGSSQFFISLEDDIFIKYNFSELIPERFLRMQDDPVVTDRRVIKESLRLQRIVQGVNFDVRTSLSKYTVILQEQSSIIRTLRNDILLSATDSSVFFEDNLPGRFNDLVSVFGREHVCRSEKLIILRLITDAWSEYLDNMSYIKDSIHIMKMSGKDPLYEYNKILVESFCELKNNINTRIDESLRSVRIDSNGPDTEALGLSKHSSTWTYIVSNQAEQLQLFPFLDSLAKAIKRNL